MSEQRQFLQGTPITEGHSPSDLVRQLTQFDGAPEQFLKHLLQVQCAVTSADGGAVVRTSAEGLRLIAVWPEPTEGTPPEWLPVVMQSSLEAIESGRTIVKPMHSPEQMYGQPAKRQVVIVPLGTQGVAGAAAFVTESVSKERDEAKRERLELTGAFLAAYEMRIAAEMRGRDLGKLRSAMEVVATVNRHDKFTGVVMAAVNELASRFRCDRVSMGFLSGRYVQLKALSHTEKFSRKMKLVQDIEAAMEECVDQDVEVLYPPDENATYVSRAAGEPSKRHGPTCILSVPMRRKGEPEVVVTLERPSTDPFDVGEVETLRLVCDLCTARVLDMHEHGRWFGTRIASSLKKGVGFVLGSKHTWAKLTTVLVLAAIMFLAFAKGDYRAEAPVLIETVELRVICAPFEGVLDAVNVDPGKEVPAVGPKTSMEVKATAWLAKLDTTELVIKLSEAQAELLGYEKQRDAAMRDKKTVEAQIAAAEADKVRARIELLEYRIEQGIIYSAIAGKVVKGDLRRQVGTRVQTGDVLFEVAPVDSLRAVLSVSEDLIADVVQADREARRNGKRAHGVIATTAHPDRRIKFEIERINPIAEVVKERNVFKVRVKLVDVDKLEGIVLFPGSEGIGKVYIDRRLYASIWTRRLINWVRMKLWM